MLADHDLSGSVTVTGASLTGRGLSLRLKPVPSDRVSSELLAEYFPGISPLDEDIVAFKSIVAENCNYTNSCNFGEEEAMQVISDLHHCRYLRGVMDEAVTEQALKTYQDTCADLLRRQRAHCTVKNLNLFILGDIMHGYHNYPAQPREVTGTMSHQIAATAHLLIRHIERERYQYADGVIRVYCVPGNHGRKGKESDLVTDNAELDVYRIIEAYFLNTAQVQVILPDETFYLIADVMGRKYLLTHGDAIKGAGNPQAVAAAVMRWQAIMPRFEDAILGHFHRLLRVPLPTGINEVVGRGLFVNGTASKDDGFLQSFGSSPSLAWWMLFSNGKRTTAAHDVSLYAA